MPKNAHTTHDDGGGNNIGLLWGQNYFNENCHSEYQPLPFRVRPQSRTTLNNFIFGFSSMNLTFIAFLVFNRLDGHLSVGQGRVHRLQGTLKHGLGNGRDLVSGVIVQQPHHFGVIALKTYKTHTTPVTSASDDNIRLHCKPCYLECIVIR